MTKYKHLPTGEVWENRNGFHYRSTGDLTRIPAHIVESGKDWEKVEEKDYEITGFRQNGEICKRYQGQYFKWENRSGHCTPESIILEALAKHKIEIFSVRRLSDGVEFKIDDKFTVPKYQGDNIFTIVSFQEATFSKKCVVRCEIAKSGVVGPYWLEDISPAPKREPLFTSKNGMEIFEGEIYTTVSLPHYSIKDWKINSKMKGTILEDLMYFSTLEAAREYVIQNKPVFSLDQIEDFSARNIPMEKIRIRARRFCGFPPKVSPCQADSVESEREEEK